jgi:2-methylisocitrate lyase-like PEP mutase family enzyme
MTEILKAGAIGINIEDGLFRGKRQLVSPEQHAAKIKAVRNTAQILGIHLFINARTDPFLLKFGSLDECLNEAARRAKVYANAGADGIFVPGLTDLALIEKFVQLTPLPVNIMVTKGVPEIPDLARVGVRRVSLGPWPMMAAMRAIERAAAAVAASKQYGTFLQPNA